MSNVGSRISNEFRATSACIKLVKFDRIRIGTINYCKFTLENEFLDLPACKTARDEQLLPTRVFMM